MTNQTRRSGELEIRVEAPQKVDATNQFGSLQFLVVKDFEELEIPKKRNPKQSSKTRCRAVRACIPNDGNLDAAVGGASKKSSGYSLSELKSVDPNVLKSYFPKFKIDISEDYGNSQSSQVSVSSEGETSDAESHVSLKDDRQPCFKRSSKPTVFCGKLVEADRKRVLDEREDMGDHQEEAKEDAAFSAECFTQLYKRIEALEGLLQRGLDSLRMSCSCKEKGKDQKTTKPKVKFLAPIKSETRLEGDSATPPEWGETVNGSNASRASGTNEERDNCDTDTELQNIKKRVIVLEEKLKRMEESTTKGDINERSPPKNEATLKKERKRSCSRVSNEKQSDAGDTLSEPDSIKHNDILFLSADLKSKLAAWKTKNKLKKSSKIHKKIRRKCSSLIISSKKSSFSKNESEAGWNYPSEQSLRRLRSFESTLCRSPLSSRPASDKRKKAAAVVYLKCQRSSVAWQSAKYCGKNKRKVKDLCRKVPVTNFVTNSAERDNEIDDPRAFGDCKFPTPGRRLRHSRREPRECRTTPRGSHRRHTRWTVSKRSSRLRPTGDDLTHRKTRFRECEVKKDKSQNTSRPFGCSTDIVKEKLKIPVLFKEVCKPMKPVQKISNISMRFVLVENDPASPLSQLIEKLSKGSSEEKREQYVFGVSKCSCDETKYPNRKVWQKGCGSKLPENCLVRPVLKESQKPATGDLCRSNYFYS